MPDIPNAYPRAQVEDWLNLHLYVPKGKKLTKEELDKLGVKNEIKVNKLGFQRCKTDRCMYVRRLDLTLLS
jgi:hypothetical protein